MAILDNEFAKGVRAQIHRLLRDRLASALEARQAKKRKAKAVENEYRSRWFRCEAFCDRRKLDLRSSMQSGRKGAVLLRCGATGGNRAES